MSSTSSPRCSVAHPASGYRSLVCWTLAWSHWMTSCGWIILIFKVSVLAMCLHWYIKNNARNMYQNSPSSWQLCRRDLTDGSISRHSFDLNRQTVIVFYKSIWYYFKNNFPIFTSFSLITPGSRPLHLSPRVSDAQQLCELSSVLHLANRCTIMWTIMSCL